MARAQIASQRCRSITHAWLYGFDSPFFSALGVVGRFAICRVGHGADILSWTEAKKREDLMKLPALIEREGDGYVSLCPELDIASQGDTIESARDNLREALELFFETASPEEIATAP